jgi:hypothetical protein
VNSESMTETQGYHIDEQERPKTQMLKYARIALIEARVFVISRDLEVREIK